ncbi:MAG: sigma-54 dependent transcriptional regulator [candidate division WOR-3 bacterium]
MKKRLVYVIDDVPSWGRRVRDALGTAEYEISHFLTGEDGLKAIAERAPDLLLLDIRLPGIDGLEVLRRLSSAGSCFPVVMMTDVDSPETVVAAMKLGAADYLAKDSLTSERIAVTVRNVLQCGELQQQVVGLRSELADRYRMIGNSAALNRVRDLISRAAPTDISILITGETGVGKELVARSFHLQSRRAARPFVVINCAAIPRDLLESELFGYEKGAFTGAAAAKPGRLETADKGTLFLDEISEMDLALQPKLLRFLQEGETQRIGGLTTARIDVRVIAATSRDLAAAARAGKFNEALYYRLASLTVEVPPLRERLEDIEPLALYFLERWCNRYDRRLELMPESLELLKGYDWHGNVRELEHFIERLVVLAQTSPVEPEEMRSLLPAAEVPLPAGTLREALAAAEAEAVRKAIASTNGNIAAAARLLGIERPSLYRIMKRHGISPPPD